MTRKDFLQTMAGAAATAAVSAVPPSATAAPAQRTGPKRGVSIYSYTHDLGTTMTLEDCFQELDDLRTGDEEIGIEILANGHIEGYPNPTDAWVKNWHDMCAKYKVRPVEYGHWVDSKLIKGRIESVKEAYDQLVRDIKLANRLGFTRGRTKLGVEDKPHGPEWGHKNVAVPVSNWQEFIKMALPVAEKYNFRMLPEVHEPALVKSKLIDEYVNFIEKEKCTPWFGINIDFGVFQNKAMTPPPGRPAREVYPHSEPEDIVPILKYVHCCHAKFNEMNDDCQDMTIPYPKIIETLVKANWNNYMMSEYEGADRGVGTGSVDAVRKQHIMLKRLLKEA